MVESEIRIAHIYSLKLQKMSWQLHIHNSKKKKVKIIFTSCIML